MELHKILQHTKLAFLGLLISFPFFSATGKSTEEAFTDIYNTGEWGRNKFGEGTSGPGSLPETTELYRIFIQQFLDQNQIQSVVDMGCGDWSFSRLINWENVNYMGYDVVKSVIEKNQAEFTQPNIHFYHGDALTTDLPPADLLICKDVLQHLSNEDISSFIQQLPKFKFCLITNDVDRRTLSSSNPDIHTGGFRQLDLTKAPFNLAGTVALIYVSDRATKQVLLIDDSSSFDVEKNGSDHLN